MKIINIDDYGKFLVVRKNIITEQEFCNALKCNIFNKSVQQYFYDLFCKYGQPLSVLYNKYKVDFPLSKMSYADFIAYTFNLHNDFIQGFLAGKRDNEDVYFVDNILVFGYKETFLFRADSEEEPYVGDFLNRFKEAIKLL